MRERLLQKAEILTEREPAGVFSLFYFCIESLLRFCYTKGKVFIKKQIKTGDINTNNRR